jgi:hypothetical protein
MKTKAMTILFFAIGLFVFHATATAHAQFPGTTPCLNVVRGHGVYYAALAKCPGIRFPDGATLTFAACVNNASTPSEKQSLLNSASDGTADFFTLYWLGYNCDTRTPSEMAECMRHMCADVQKWLNEAN